MREITIFSGSAHVELAQEVCDSLHVPLSPTILQRFSNDCLQVQLKANCRESDVFIIQPLTSSVQEHLVELFLMADLLVTAGANRVLVMTLHAPQVHGFFSVPTDHLNALNVLSRYFRGRDLRNTVVVSPDLGNAKSASYFARMLRVPVAAGSKQRLSDDSVVIEAIVGDVEGKDVIIVDDEISNGGTILKILGRLREHHTGKVVVACTHGVFSDMAIERLRSQPDITEIVTTNTVPIPQEKRLPNMTVLSIAPLLAEAIRRIHNGESVSSLFVNAL